MKKFTLSIAAVMAMSTFAIADANTNEDLYIGIAWGFANIEADASYGTETVNLDLDHDAVMYQVGYKINRYVAVEGRYWDSVGDGDASVSYTDSANPSNNISAEGDVPTDFNAWGLYVKPMLPLNEAFTAYALVGWGSVEFEFEGQSADERSFQWGLGASYNVNENVSYFIDYTKLYDDDEAIYDITGNVSIDSLNFGVNYKF